MIPFSEKLSFLMHLANTSNKELAAELNVNPSLISLLRTGKRKLARNPVYSKKMADFFAHRCTASFQRQALSETLGVVSISSSLPEEDVSDCIERWLLGHEEPSDIILSGIQNLPKQLKKIPEYPLTSSSSSMPEGESLFFYGEEGRREVFTRVFKELFKLETPCPILFVIDDNLEWLLSDYPLTITTQSRLRELASLGFTFYQIMPPANYINRYAESMQFWLPLYATGQVKPYYYPRLRGNLYRHSMIVVPGRCAQYAASVGSGSTCDITMLTTDKKLVAAFEKQFQEYLSLCRPSMTVHQDTRQLFPLLNTLFTSHCDTIQMTNTLSATTLPPELLKSCILESNLPDFSQSLQQCLDHIPQFEEHLSHARHIDMARLATADEVRSGNVYIASPHAMSPGHPRYTPQTYILHLQNILHLMDTYENYYFLPLHDQDVPDYNLYISESGLSLITRTAPPIIMMEIHRQFMATALQEHLLRRADAVDYTGTFNRSSVHMELRALIQELSAPPQIRP